MYKVLKVKVLVLPIIYYYIFGYGIINTDQPMRKQRSVEPVLTTTLYGKEPRGWAPSKPPNNLEGCESNVKGKKKKQSSDTKI